MLIFCIDIVYTFAYAKAEVNPSGVNIMSRSSLIPKETSVQLRISNMQKDILSKAAYLQSTTLSNFVLSNAYQAAQQILTEQAHFSLAPEKWFAFCAALDQPARSISSLESLLNTPGLLDE